MGKYLDLIKQPPSSQTLPEEDLPISMEASGFSQERSLLRNGATTATREPAEATTLTTETTKAPLPDMPLSQFEVEGVPLQIAVPGLSETLWFVPDGQDAFRLVNRGMRRGRVWTAAELRVVAALPEASQQELLTLARLKARFDGDVVEVLEPEPDPAAPGNPEPNPSCHACSGRRFWRSIHGVVVCGECHPPASDSLVAEWVEVPEPGTKEKRP